MRAGTDHWTDARRACRRGIPHRASRTGLTAQRHLENKLTVFIIFYQMMNDSFTAANAPGNKKAG